MGETTLDMNALGRSLTRRREALGWTTYRLAQHARLSDPYVRNLERGVGKRVGIEIVARLARALGTSTDDLLRDAGIETGGGLIDEMTYIYNELTQAERRAWIRIGRVLLDMRREQMALQEEPEIVEEPLAFEPVAAYDREIPDGEEWPLEQP